MANGTINARERIKDPNGRQLNIDHRFSQVKPPEVGQVTAGIKAQAVRAPTDGQAQPIKRPRPRSLFG